MDSPSSGTPTLTGSSYPATAVSRPDPFNPRSLFNSLRNQLISGLILSLPVVITFWIIYWIFMTLERVPARPCRRPHPSDHRVDEELPVLGRTGPSRLVVQHRIASFGNYADVTLSFI